MFCEDEAPDLWAGIFGNAPIERGAPGYQYSDGERVTL